jgi:hypothetical protein
MQRKFTPRRCPKVLSYRTAGIPTSLAKVLNEALLEFIISSL